MSCEESKRVELSGYADGELGADERQWWDDHLRGCASCREELARINALRATLHDQLPAREPSPAFRDAVRRAVRAQSRAPRKIGARRWGWTVGLAATLLFAVGLGLGYAAGGRGARDPMVGEVVTSHLRSLEASHLVDVASSEHHVVKPWFAGRLDFSPPVPDLAPVGFPLVGGRVDYLGGRRVAALVYARGPHRINLLIWPEAGTGGCHLDPAVVRQGFNLVHGRAGGMAFWAISDLNRQELDEFAGRWQRAAAPGESGCGADTGETR